MNLIQLLKRKKNYCVADILMVKEIRRKIKELVLEPYQEFCNRFSKNYSMDRQMKYDVESVEIIIDRLFDAPS
uniref:Exocyst complex subunit Exo70 C-terminal domain-containing protein n=1 Tax=Panagrolaimus sp. JU765 TaxID=591449 RepID=A0AC34R6Q5_9BILA